MGGYRGLNGRVAATKKARKYDAENRLISYSNTAGASSSYVYDGLGQRVEKTSSGPNECNNTSGTVFYLRDLANHTAVYTTQGVNQCHDEIYAGGRHLVTYAGAAVFSHSDWLGTERRRVNSAYVANPGNDQTYTSYPFGDNLTGNLGTYASALHFTGQPHDIETGLDYFGARHNSSSIGRFISPDPSNLSVDFSLPQTWNRYAYALDNPLKVVDRNGLWPWWVHNEIINESFPGMSKQDLQRLKDASWRMDMDPGKQEPVNSFQHGMRDGPNDQDPMVA